MGVGPVTACELIIKTENFQKLDTAKRCAAYAGIAPYPKESGKMKCNNHSSPLGDKHLKSLLFLCARSAQGHNKEILLYFIRKYQIEKKPYYLVINNVANKLLRILYGLIHKGELYDRDHIQIDPRNNQEIRKGEKYRLLYIKPFYNSAEPRRARPCCFTIKACMLYDEQGFPRRKSSSHTEKLTTK